MGKPKIKQFHRPAKNIDYQEIKQIVSNISPLNEQVLFCICYGWGCRITEACNVSMNDITFNDDFLNVRIKVLKKIKHRKDKETGQYIIDEKTGDPKEFGKLQFRMPPISRKLEPWITEPIIQEFKARQFGWIQLQANMRAKGIKDIPPQKIYRYCKRTAQNRFDKYFNAVSHSFRHSRTLHLIIIYGWSLPYLISFFKLSPQGATAWLRIYAELDNPMFQTNWNEQLSKLEPKIVLKQENKDNAANTP